MASSRTRPAPSAAAASAPPDEASLAPWVPAQSLAELKDAMSSPGVIQAEVDALLAAIARPPGADETPRARADFLLTLMDLPEEARDRTGSDGRTVRTAAVEALMELGYPYALEVHPDVLEAVRQESGVTRDTREGISRWALGITLLSMVVQLGYLALFFAFGSSGRYWEPLVLMVTAMVAVPPLLALFGKWVDSRSLQKLGVVGLVLQGLVWLFPTLSEAQRNLPSSLLSVLLFPWHLPLVAAYLMRPKPEPGDAVSPPETPPTEPS
jgi:hypothetical protein